MDLTVPTAFEAAAEEAGGIERRVRYRCRDAFAEMDLLGRVVKDIEYALDIRVPETDATEIDADPSLPGGLWDPDKGKVEGGQNYGQQSSGEQVEGKPPARDASPPKEKTP